MLCLVFLWPQKSKGQLDSLAKDLYDTLKAVIIDDEIPKKTFGDLFMYPHRWYIKQLLTPRLPYYDTNYIASHKKKLNLSLAVAKKFFGFNLSDLSLNQTVKFLPNTPYHLGFNCSNIIVSFGVYPGISYKTNPAKGSTSSRDFQLMIIGRRVITDINYQRYKGMYTFNSRPEELNRVDASDYTVRPDINVFAFGVNTMFVFNFKKYSLRGAFSFTDIQKKSAGSFLAGLYHSYVLFSSFDSTILLSRNKIDFSPEMHDIINVSLITVGLSGGYGYTFVWRQWVLSAAATVGIGGQKSNYELLGKVGRSLAIRPTASVNLKTALRYDKNNFFTGIMATYNNNHTLNPTFFNTENYLGKVVLFCGYRFNLKGKGRKLLKKAGLVDYNKPKTSARN